MHTLLRRKFHVRTVQVPAQGEHRLSHIAELCARCQCGRGRKHCIRAQEAHRSKLGNWNEPSPWQVQCTALCNRTGLESQVSALLVQPRSRYHARTCCETTSGKRPHGNPQVLFEGQASIPRTAPTEPFQGPVPGLPSRAGVKDPLQELNIREPFQGPMPRTAFKQSRQGLTPRTRFKE
jgi:hypothetical protein